MREMKKGSLSLLLLSLLKDSAAPPARDRQRYALCRAWGQPMAGDAA